MLELEKGTLNVTDYYRPGGLTSKDRRRTRLIERGQLYEDSLIKQSKECQ